MKFVLIQTKNHFVRTDYSGCQLRQKSQEKAVWDQVTKD